MVSWSDNLARFALLSLQKEPSSARDRIYLDVTSSIIICFHIPSELQDFAIAPLDDPGPAPLGYLDHGDDGYGCG